ncbi:MAG: UDP-N-acetylmuramoyl-tripeptide--D-alanyl-D-alanine ligase [Tannerellaceae bacterium]|nr:UDP-N-acetylmuramoyl-tripeptide--D-alanyl-D-alanine ligase [Tannerellaceae bacterium]
MDASDLYELFLRHPQITTDSRNCPAGSLFFALRGGNFDGNQFAEKALAAGAAYAVIDRAEYDRGERTLLVDDALKTLQDLAQHHRRMRGIPLIGITGTNGKTTTKELLVAVLSNRFRLLYSEGNLNNHIGVPLTLLGLTRAHEMAVIEMGASHPGDIAELVEIARPDYGIVTNVGRAHLQGFGSLEGVVRAKGELYDYLRRTQGVVFIKSGDERLTKMSEGISRRVTYGTTYGATDGVTHGATDGSFVSGSLVKASPLLTFHWGMKGEAFTGHRVETRLVGAYNLDNVMAAVAVGCYFGIPAGQINRAIASYVPVNNRSQWQETPRNHLIIDAYNANPDSMKAALRNFAALSISPKALILGDMKELGLDSPALHREILKEVQNASFHAVFLCGACFARAAVGTRFASFLTTEELIDALRRNPLSGYNILLKGSRGMGLERCVEVL